MLPPASMAMELQMIVSVGLVVGAIAPITPKGQYSTNVRPSSPAIACVVRSSTPGDFSAARAFLIILCSNLPIPLSPTANLLIYLRLSWSQTTLRIPSTYFCRSERERNMYSFPFFSSFFLREVLREGIYSVLIDIYEDRINYINNIKSCYSHTLTITGHHNPWSYRKITPELVSEYRIYMT